MGADSFRFESLLSVASDSLSSAVSYIPSLLAAILVVIVGWIIARIARGAARRISNSVNRLLDRFFRRGTLSHARLSPSAMVILGEIAFWAILFLAATVAARVAGFTALSGWLNQIVTRLPNLLVGAAIIVVGYVVSILVGEQVAATARAANVSQSTLIGRLAQAAIFVTTLIIGLDQIGIDVTFLIALFAVGVGAIFLGFSIAFGLGARDYVSNLIGARIARRELKIGQSVRIGDIEGEILDITSTQIALETAHGKTLVPAHLAEKQSIVIVVPGGDQETAGD
jgi:small-conductance mechanosensitive channel